MESDEVAKLKIMVSRLYGLGVANLSTVMNLSHALVSSESLSRAARDAAQMAFDSIQEQIDILRELGEIEGITDAEQ
ncbi:hypothetical protein MRS45_20445 [Pseudomonas viridiflava]|uniref:hypothetical protein n=1 Tax=Pseudomonas viridiflava TaxID=33069 RepID=UPI001FD63848|nr:hypothetical protein [Pseudomonas viridiflava]MCJ8178471.1 hypothetical protein [Pseudomonas viridiflava]